MDFEILIFILKSCQQSAIIYCEGIWFIDADCQSLVGIIWRRTIVVVQPTKHTKDTKKTMAELLYPEESYAIMGACFQVYKDKGCGFTEAVYQECLEIEFEHHAVPFIAQADIQLSYRGRKLKQGFKADFVCYGKIILELKAVSRLIDAHRAQLLNYMNATAIKLGILVNFGNYPRVEYERLVLTPGKENFYERQRINPIQAPVGRGKKTRKDSS